MHCTATHQIWHQQTDAPVPCILACARSTLQHALTLTGVPAEMPQARGNSSVACTARNRPQDLRRTRHGTAWMSMLMVSAASALSTGTIHIVPS